MNDEMFRLSLIELMNSDLLNDFVNAIFDYNLKEDEYIYIQYKIVKGNIVLNFFDNGKENRFKAYIFSLNDFSNDDESVIYINVNSCHYEYKNKNINNVSKLSLLGALLKTDKDYEKKEIIDYLFKNNMNKIFIDNFIL